MAYSKDVLETINMIERENLDIRTVTLGISLLDCIDSDIDKCCDNVYNKIVTTAKDLVTQADLMETDYGIPIVHKRVAVTPISLLASATNERSYLKFAKTLDKAAQEIGINFIGGFSAIVPRGFSPGDKVLLETIPEALSETERVMSSVNLGSTKLGINMDAVKLMGQIIKETA